MLPKHITQHLNLNFNSFILNLFIINIFLLAYCWFIFLVLYIYGNPVCIQPWYNHSTTMVQPSSCQVITEKFKLQFILLYVYVEMVGGGDNLKSLNSRL